MNKYIYTIAILLFSWKSAFALICNNTLIEDNAPLHEVQKACSGGTEYRVNNAGADIVKYYYNEGKWKHEMVFIDGNLKEDNEHIDMTP